MKNSKGKSVSIKGLHALVDELATSASVDVLNAVSILLGALAATADENTEELDLELAADGDDADDEKPAKRGKRGAKPAADADDGDDDLDALNDLEDDDEKPAKRGSKKAPVKVEAKPARRGAKKVAEPEEAELPEIPTKVAAFDAFLDELDALDGEDFGESFTEYADMGVRELTAALNGMGVDPAGLIDGELPAGKEGRLAKVAAYAGAMAKFAYLTEQLIESPILEKLAKANDVEVADFKAGKSRNKKIAEATVAAIYGGEE